MHRKIKMYLFMAAFVFLAGCSKENRNVTETNNRIQKPQESLESQQAGEENQEEQETQEDQEEQRKIEKVTALETNVSMDGWNELDNSETEDENDKEEKDDEKKELLTLDRVLELSRKEKLEWSDFDGYTYEDVGFGLYIHMYDIDADFYLLVGGTGGGEPMYVHLVSAKEKEKFIDLVSQDVGEKEVEDFILENKGTSYCVSIPAHVKEIKQDGILISSDTDEFPGVFFVTGVRDAMSDEEFWKLKGGMHFRILMEDMNRKNVENGNLAEYRAKEMILLSDDEDFGQEDILLLSAPELELNNALSSFYDSYIVQSGSYTWTVEENGEEKQEVACGASPLDETGLKKEKLKIPNYSTTDGVMNSVPYLYSTKIQPDILTLRQWNIADMGDNQAKEEQVTVYYGKTSIVDLQRDKLYEFTAEWLKINLPENKFYAEVSYTVATE